MIRKRYGLNIWKHYKYQVNFIALYSVAEDGRMGENARNETTISFLLASYSVAVDDILALNKTFLSTLRITYHCEY